MFDDSYPIIVGPAMAARLREEGLLEGEDFILDQQLPLFGPDEDEDDDDEEDELHDDTFSRAYFADVARRITLINDRGIETVIASARFL